jgi:outer membrane protein
MRLSHAVLAGLLAAVGPAFAGTPLPNPVGPYPDNTLPTDEPDHVPHTVADALGIAYETNPMLTGERAHLRSTDENLPQALAGWRPTVTVTATDGFNDGRQDVVTPCDSGSAGTAPQNNKSCYKNGVPNPNYVAPPPLYPPNPNFVSTNDFIDSTLVNRNQNAETATVTEYLYRSGKTAASTHQADNSIYAERARLNAEEEQVLLNGITAYVTYVEDTQLLELDVQNERVLGDELRAVSDRYRVGELTRVDVAQAQAALAAAIAQRETAEGNLQTAAATFYYDIGVNPPKDLADPQPLRLPVRSEKEAAEVAESNNPTVVAALFNQAEMKDAIDVSFAALGPQIYLQGQGYKSTRVSLAGYTTYGFQGTINLTMPLYQGGAEYSTVRQARQNYQQAVRQTENAVTQAHEQAVSAWDTLIAARAAVDSSRIAVRSAEIAVEGIERQALVGSATTQDVLIQQQNLLSAQITLVQNVTSVVTSSYTVANAIGRLTAKDLGLAVPLYDETAYYNAVKNRLWGTGDYAVHQPGR